MPFAPLPWWKNAFGQRPPRRCSCPWIARRLNLEILERRLLLSSDTLGTATLLSFNSSQTAQAAGFLSQANEVDLYKVHLDHAGDRLSVAVSAQTSGSGLQSLPISSTTR